MCWVSEGNLNIRLCYNFSLGSSHTCSFLTAKLARDDQIHILKQHRRKELETRQKQYRWVMTQDQMDMRPWFLLFQRHGVKWTLSQLMACCCWYMMTKISAPYDSPQSPSSTWLPLQAENGEQGFMKKKLGINHIGT